MAKYTVFYGSDMAYDWEDNKVEFDNFADAKDYYMSLGTASLAYDGYYMIEEKSYGKRNGNRLSVFDDPVTKYRVAEYQKNIEALDKEIDDCDKQIEKVLDSAEKADLLVRREVLVAQREVWLQTLEL